MDRLRQFNGDLETKRLLIDFIYDHINVIALERMYRKEDVSHIADAKELIDGAFSSLEETYKINIKQDEPSNQAR